MTPPRTSSVECVRDSRQAATLLHPLRLEILELASGPSSAADIARRLDLPRQKVNYHVKELARAGLLKRAGRARKGNLIEQRYVASARSYVLDPELLGRLAIDREPLEDRLSASRLLALAGRTQHELGGLVARAEGEERRLATLSIDVDVAFTSAAERARFAIELRDQIAALAGRYPLPADPAPTGAGEERDDRPASYRLVVACYPKPREEPAGSRASKEPSP